MTSDPVNDDRDAVKLRPRFACSKHSAGPQLLIRKVRNVGLAVPGIYEDSVLVDHGESLPSRTRGARRARAERATAASGGPRDESVVLYLVALVVLGGGGLLAGVIFGWWGLLASVAFATFPWAPPWEEHRVAEACRRTARGR